MLIVVEYNLKIAGYLRKLLPLYDGLINNLYLIKREILADICIDIRLDDRIKSSAVQCPV